VLTAEVIGKVHQYGFFGKRALAIGEIRWLITPVGLQVSQIERKIIL
jgi:hypothetical protein